MTIRRMIPVLLVAAACGCSEKSPAPTQAQPEAASSKQSNPSAAQAMAAKQANKTVREPVKEAPYDPSNPLKGTPYEGLEGTMTQAEIDQILRDHKRVQEAGLDVPAEAGLVSTEEIVTTTTKKK